MRTLDIFKQVILKCSKNTNVMRLPKVQWYILSQWEALCCLLKEPEALQEVLHLSNSISDIKPWKWSGVETPVWLPRCSLFKVNLYSEGYLELQKIPLCFCISLLHRGNVDFRNYLSDHRIGQRSNEHSICRTSTMQPGALQPSPEELPVDTVSFPTDSSPHLALPAMGWDHQHT